MRRNTFTIITALSLTGGCADFNPDLSMAGSTGTGTEGDETDGTGGSTGDGTSGETGGSSTEDETDGSSTGDETSGETGSTDDTGGAVCGNGVVEEDEECDGDDLLGATCEDGGYYGGGSVLCVGDCTLNFTACEDLVYEQNFETDMMPDEIELIGEPTAYPFLVKYPLETVDGNPWGSCMGDHDDFCVQTGPITHGQASGIKMLLNFAGPGEVRSWVRGWTEKFDVLEVQLDGSIKCEYSANFLTWNECVIPVNTAGVHTLVWIYRKDGSISEGFDTAWVDAITATNAEPL